MDGNGQFNQTDPGAKMLGDLDKNTITVEPTQEESKSLIGMGASKLSFVLVFAGGVDSAC